MPANSLVQRPAKGVSGKYSPERRLPARRAMRGSKIGKVYGHLIIPRLFIDQMNRHQGFGNEDRRGEVLEGQKTW